MNHGHQMKMAANDQQPVQAAPKSTSELKIDATIAPDPAKVGANSVTISIRDIKTGEPKKGLK
ncbi:hypothetical protein ACSTIK_00075, partial [Vibrio parahaemolyticus]